MPVTGKTFEQMKAAIADWLGMRDADTHRFPESVRGDVVNLKMRELMRKYDFRFMEATTTQACVIGTRTYALPTDFSRPLTIQYQKSGVTATFMEQLLPEEYDVRYLEDTTVSTGQPQYYMIFGSNLYLGPVPDATYSLKIKYYKFMADLSNGSPNNTNDVLTYAWDVILWEALSEATLYGIEDPRVPIFKQKAQEALQALIIEHTRSRSAGRKPIAGMPGSPGQ